MKTRKLHSLPKPGYPTARQAARSSAAAGMVAVSLAAVSACCAPEAQLAGDIAVEPIVQPPGGIRAPASTNAAPQRSTHTVQKGDTLASLAQRYLGDAKRAKEIADANPGRDANALKPGTVLVIPAACAPKADEPLPLPGSPPVPSK